MSITVSVGLLSGKIATARAALKEEVGLDYGVLLNNGLSYLP